MARRKKAKDGTWEAFMQKKHNKITKDEANEIMKHLKHIYSEYVEMYERELDKDFRDKIEDDYIHEAGSIIRKIKQVASDFHELNPGVASIIGCVQYNMKYTQLKQGKEQFKWK